MKRTVPYIIILLLISAAVLFFLEIFLGPVHISFNEIVKILFAGNHPDSAEYTIIMESRLPRVCAAAVAGVGLAWSGWLMQTLFRNPLAGPSVLGITSGASLGVAILILISGSAIGYSGNMAVALASIVGAVCVLGIVMVISNRIADSITLLLFGIMLGYFVSAIVSALQFKASSDALKTFVLWGMGSFSEAGLDDTLWMVGTIVIAAVVIFVMLKPLNLLLLGDEYAISLGLNIRRVRMWIVLAVGLMTGVTTAFCGPIAFIGLVVPHLVRSMMKTSEHRRLFVPVGLMGMVCAIGSDVLSRLLELPLNAVVSALGAPVVIYVIIKGSKSKAII